MAQRRDASPNLTSGLRLGRILTAAGLAVVLLAPASLAQEVGEPEPETPDRLHQTGTLDIPLGVRTTATGVGTNRSDLHVWSEGRLGYMFSGGSKGFSPTGGNHVEPTRFGIVAIDLDTFEVVADTGCSEPPTDAGLPSGTPGCKTPVEEAFPYWIDQELAQERRGAFAIDAENGVLYVAHHNAIGYGRPGSAVGGDLLGNVDPTAANAALCSPTNAQGSTPCFAGLYVLDARTLEVLRDIPFHQVGLDAAGVELTLLHMSHSPHPGEQGKVHVLLEERAHNAVGGTATVGVDARGRFNQQWVAQIDVATGAADWVERAGGCVGYRSVGAPGLEGPLGAVFRSPDPDRPVVWVGCWAGGDRVSGIVRLDLDPSDPQERAVVGQQAFVAPGSVTAFRADPTSERIFVKSVLEEALWWVFDGREGGFVSRVGIGPDIRHRTVDGFDPSSGRLYTLAQDLANARRGIGWVDGRRAELPQYTWDPAFASHHPGNATDGVLRGARIAVDPADGDRPRRVLVKPSTTSAHFLVLEDTVPVTTDPPPAEAEVRSDDVAEREGATSRSFTASARGYGARTILVSGIDGVTGRHGGTGVGNAGISACRGTHRVLAFGLAGSPEPSQRAEIDGLGGAAGTAQATYADSTTEGDLGTPYSRCRTAPLPAWNAAGLPVRGLDEPGGRLPGREEDASPVPGTTQVSCALPDRPEDDAADPVFTGLTAEVSCREDAVTGASRARAVGVGPIDVAEAASTYRVERRDGGGVVARVESWTRGLTVAGDQGVVKIDTVRAVATTWADGRAQPEDAAEHPNCDMARSAGTCYERFFGGAQVVDAAGDTLFSCDPCADPENHQRLVAAMQSALGASWLVSAPHPDPDLAAGAADGSQAAVLKRASVAFADQFLKGDLLMTLPALEFVRVTDSESSTVSRDSGTGRQVFQFAGVEADLSYAISCLLTIVDGECMGEPASLDIELTDVLGVPLPGGAFEVHEAGEDGVLDLEASLGDPLVCVTGPDGSCGFDEVAPGTYVVQQMAAPDGYLPMDEQVIDLPPGAHGTLSVVNGALPVTGLAITLTDLDGDALEGGEFAVHLGETVADGAVALATCATDELGVCRFPAPAVDLVELPLPAELVIAAVPDAPDGLLQVPAGGYTVRQASAPEGYEPVDDVTFELPEGQIARVTLSNAPPWDDEGAVTDVVTSDVAQGAVEPVAFAQAPPVAEPVFSVELPDGDLPMAAGPGDGDGPSAAQRVFTLPADAARFALRHPKEALAFGGVLLLFAGAVAGVHRRRLLLDLLNT